jgi:hypothetical protein
LTGIEIKTYNWSMIIWKQPPIAKVYEALGAIADGRVITASPTSAQVVSSSGDKSYSVEWAEDFSWITSNDNASYWQGYFGYPIIAVLLLQGKISYDKSISETLKGIPWKKVNTRYKNDYDKSINEVLEQASAKGRPRDAIVKECERVHTELKNFKIEKPKQVRKPPPAGKESISTPQESQANLF